MKKKLFYKNLKTFKKFKNSYSNFNFFTNFYFYLNKVYKTKLLIPTFFLSIFRFPSRIFSHMETIWPVIESSITEQQTIAAFSINITRIKFLYFLLIIYLFIIMICKFEKKKINKQPRSLIFIICTLFYLEKWDFIYLAMPSYEEAKKSEA